MIKPYTANDLPFAKLIKSYIFRTDGKMCKVSYIGDGWLVLDSWHKITFEELASYEYVSGEPCGTKE